MFWKNKNILLPRVSGNLKPVEYAGKNRFSKYSRFLWPWSLVITHSHLTWTMICFHDSYAMHTFSLYFFQLNRAHASQWEYIWPRSSVLPGDDRIWNIFTIKLQGRFRQKTAIFWTNGFYQRILLVSKYPKRMGATISYFFKTLLDHAWHTTSRTPSLDHNFMNTISILEEPFATYIESSKAKFILNFSGTDRFWSVDP